MMGESGGAAKITIKYPPGDLLFKDLANLHNDYMGVPLDDCRTGQAWRLAKPKTPIVTLRFVDLLRSRVEGRLSISHDGGAGIQFGEIRHYRPAQTPIQNTQSICGGLEKGPAASSVS
jgi:hypothetical protein